MDGRGGRGSEHADGGGDAPMGHSSLSGGAQGRLNDRSSADADASVLSRNADRTNGAVGRKRRVREAVRKRVDDRSRAS